VAVVAQAGRGERMRRAAIASLAWLALAGCDERKPSKPAPTSSAGAALSASASAPKPPPMPATYQGGATEPLAKRYCEEVVLYPATRRAACCSGVPAAPVTGCIRNLSDALRSKTLTVDEGALAECAAEVKKRHEGCAWMGPVAPEVPEACSRALVAAVERGEPCRSSLECKGDMHCRAAGALEAGRCSGPQPAGAPCANPVEGLAAFIGLAPYVARTKRECVGGCAMHACEDKKAAGAACSSDGECAAGHACLKGACAEAPPSKVGAPCGAGCESDLRCMGGKCIKPQAPGQACSVHGDCLVGGCVKPPGSPRGKCGMRCEN
jgi:hypothetical protein